MAIESEGDWKCPKCDGIMFYKTREAITVGATRITQYQDVRKCEKCDVAMISALGSKVDNASSGCVTTLSVLAFLGFALFWLIQLFN